jgi:anti-sigma B factor antagonist
MNFSKWLSLSEVERKAERRNWRPFEPGYWHSLAVEAVSRFREEFGSERHITGVFKSLYQARELIVAVQTKSSKKVDIPSSYLGFKVMQFGNEIPEGVLVEVGPSNKKARGKKRASPATASPAALPRSPDPKAGSHHVLSLEGEIDLHVSPGIALKMRNLIKSKPEKLVIDLSNVSYIDSSGLAVLIEGMQTIEAYRGKLYLVGMTENVRTIFETSRLNQVFRIRENAAEALAASAS